MFQSGMPITFSEGAKASSSFSVPACLYNSHTGLGSPLFLSGYLRSPSIAPAPSPSLSSQLCHCSPSIPSSPFIFFHA